MLNFNLNFDTLSRESLAGYDGAKNTECHKYLLLNKKMWYA